VSLYSEWRGTKLTRVQERIGSLPSRVGTEEDLRTGWRILNNFIKTRILHKGKSLHLFLAYLGRPGEITRRIILRKIPVYTGLDCQGEKTDDKKKYG
jgi:hypothetical protein